MSAWSSGVSEYWSVGVMNERVIPSGARELTFGLPMTQMIGRYRLHRLRGPSPRKFGVWDDTAQNQ
ncbi:MAG: hypothetical protein DME44_13755 [Verrucomicrobia bacterium]|nr:MAG: hypothetical protein DME44_13755 [Verrucomicrobiota bacterium]